MNKMKLAGLGLVFLLFLPMALAVSEVELTQFNYYFYEDNFVYTVDFENTGGQEKDVNIFLAVRHKGNSTIFKADQFIFHLNEKYTEERALALDQDNYNISVISKYTDANNFEQTHIDNFLLVDIFDYFNIPFENIETPTAQQINAIQPQTLSCQPLSCPSGTVEVGSVNCDNNYCTRTCYNTTCQKQWQVISDNTGAWSTKNVPNNYNRVAFNRNLFNYTGFSTSYCYQVDTKTDNSMIATSSSSDITNYNDLDDYDSAMALVWTLENQNAQEIVAPWGGPCNNDGSGVF